MIAFFRKTCCLCPLVFLFCTSEAQNMTGTWQGNLDDVIITLDTSTLAKFKSQNTASINNQITQAMAALNSKWYKYFISFNPQPYLEKLDCKVLALNGSKDVQVIATTNLEGVKQSLQKSKSPKYDV